MPLKLTRSHVSHLFDLNKKQKCKYNQLCFYRKFISPTFMGFHTKSSTLSSTCSFFPQRKSGELCQLIFQQVLQPKFNQFEVIYADHQKLTSDGILASTGCRSFGSNDFYCREERRKKLLWFYSVKSLGNHIKYQRGRLYLFGRLIQYCDCFDFDVTSILASCSAQLRAPHSVHLTQTVCCCTFKPLINMLISEI